MDTVILALLLARMCIPDLSFANGALRSAALFRRPGFWAYLIRRAELKHDLQLAQLHHQHAQVLSRELRPGVTVTESTADWHVQIWVPRCRQRGCRASVRPRPAHSRRTAHCRVLQQLNAKGSSIIA
jgi:hypothetical protein